MQYRGLPQHRAVSPRLTVALELKLSGYAADFVLPEAEAEPQRFSAQNGKPEAYRYVLRQSRVRR